MKISLSQLPDLGWAPQQRLVMRLLVEAYPDAVSTSQIMDRLYSGTRDGGIRSFSSSLTQIRRLLRVLGWEIPKAYAGMGNDGQYRLVEVST